MIDVLCMGELLVDLCSTAVDRPLAQSPAFVPAPGGAPANVAVAVQRLGGSAGFIGAVGPDPFGAMLRQTLQREGVDVTGLAEVPTALTPLAFVAVRSDGAGDFFFYHNAGLAPLRPEHVSEALIAGGRCLHFGSISRIDEPARLATDRARTLARQKGLLVSYDPNYRPRLWSNPDEARRRIREGFAGNDVAKVSDQEWEFVFGTAGFLAGAAWAFDQGVGLVIRSEGQRGASFATRACSGHADAFAVASVEFTGAGDAFVGSVLVDLLSQGTPVGRLSEPALRAIVRRACAVGALATTKPGAIPALPTREEVNTFLAQRTA